MLLLGGARIPRCFNGKCGEEIGGFYRNNKKPRMNGGLFSEWLSGHMWYTRWQGS